jgi:hypothetical protein
MSSCSVDLPGGINQNCQLSLSEIKNILICDKDVKFAFTAKDTLANWTNLIKQSLTIYGVAGLVNYSPTTDDPNIITNAVSKTKSISNTPNPSFEFMLDSNVCDFKSLLNTLTGGVYGIFFELQNGAIQGWLDQSGNETGYFKPYKVKLNAFTKGGQEIDSNEAFKLYCFFTSYKQIQDQFYFEPTWDVSELLDAMPVGLNVVKTGAYSSGDIVVNIKTRCEDGYTGLVAADFDESTTKSNVSVPAVTAVTDSGGGNYTLTVQKGASPANLAAGDYVYFRVKKLSGSDVTHVSDWVKVEGA